MLKNRKHIFLILLMLPIFSCTKYELDGSIDNPDFVGTWVFSKENIYYGQTRVITWEIKENGRYKDKTVHTYPVVNSERKETKRYRGIVEIKDSIIKIERRRKPFDSDFGS